MHVDRLYELLASLGYTTVDEEVITRIASEVTSASEVDLGGMKRIERILVTVSQIGVLRTT